MLGTYPGLGTHPGLGTRPAQGTRPGLGTHHTVCMYVCMFKAFIKPVGFQGFHSNCLNNALTVHTLSRQLGTVKALP